MDKKIKICCVVGTRPEAIKMAPVINELNDSTWATPYVLATAQHREMLDTMMAIFNIKVDADLDIMVPNQQLSHVLSRSVDRLTDAIADDFDAVLTQGDTTTVLATALVCFYKQIPFGHIEAGLRTGDIREPFPEEMNRLLSSHLARWHFAPTAIAKKNLLSEGIPKSSIFLTGNTVIDALLTIATKDAQPDMPFDVNHPFVLITAHRRENFGEPLARICKALLALAEKFKETNFIYPVHPNPKIMEPVNKYLSGNSNIKLIAPLDYVRFVTAMKNCLFIISDSGGVEEEAPALGKPILVLRETTEREEIIRLGVGFLVGSNEQKIVSLGTRLLTDNTFYQSMIKGYSPYGDGHAAEKIIAILERELTNPTILKKIA